MQSLPSSIVASLVLGVLLYANPTEAACSTVALIAAGTDGATYVTAVGVNKDNDCGTSDTVRATCTVAIPDGKFCATDCVGGTITVKNGAVGATGTDTIFTAFTSLTPSTKYVSTAGVAGTNSHGDCNGGIQVLQTNWAAITTNKWNKVAGNPGTFTSLGSINVISPAVFTTAIATNKYFKTPGAVGTFTTTGSDVVTAAFTTVVPTGKYASTKGVIGAVVAAGTFTTAGSDVLFTACSTCAAFQSVTTACVKGVPTAAGGWVTADAGKDTVCSANWATCASTDGSAATLSNCKCGTAGCATGKFCTSAANSCAAVATSGAASVTLSTAAFVVAAFAAALPLRN